MLKELLKLTLILTPVVGMSQSKYDMGAASIVENYRQAAKLPGQGLTAASEEPVTLMVSISGDSVVAQLEELGADIKSVRNNVAIVDVAPSKIEAMAQLPGVISIEQGREQSAMMYFARQSGNADVVLDGTGEGLQAAYTGKDVVAGLMDQGIDPNHVAFYNADQSENRVKAVYTYMSSSPTGTPNASYLTPDQIAAFKCDNSAWSHGTHVAAIMAGGYNGISNYGLNRKLYEGSPMPYYGLASGADIVMSGGYLYDSNILDGVEKVIDYAKSVNKPAVVNLSLGSTPGPHDGTSALCRYLAGLGEDAIIVVAAGNDGSTNCALNATFNRLAPSVTTGISILDTSAQSHAEFWYSTSDAFQFEFLLCNRVTGETHAYKLPEAGKNYTITTSDATFGSAFASGSAVVVYGNVDPNNNRYYVRLNMILARGADSNTGIVPAVRVTGATGKKLAATISNGEFIANGISGAVGGTANGSISDMATGDNIIVVGAYTSSKSFTTASGAAMSYADATDSGQLCTFSSYGTTFQGNPLPDLCAPGSAIVSAVNSYAYTSPGKNYYTADATFKGRKNYWAAMQGTSMACPFVAGTVALMLEADPTLDVATARAILSETAVAPSASATSDEKLQWGAGRIDVLAAVKKVLDNKASVGAVLEDDARNFILTPADGSYNVYVAGEPSLAVTVYDMAGHTVASASADGNAVDVDTSSLRPGIYLLVAQGRTQRHTAKIVVK